MEALQHLAFIRIRMGSSTRAATKTGRSDSPNVSGNTRPRLGRSEVRLDSFLFSQTPYQAISWWGHTQAELEEKHVLFRDDQPQRAMRKMFELMGTLPAAG